MTKNKILCYVATLGALMTATGCTTTYVVGDNFRAPTPRARVAYEQKMPRRPAAVIVAQPLVVAPVVAAPVIYARPAYRCSGWGWGGGRGYYGNGGYGVRSAPGLNPTAGTHLGNTMDGTTNYYREYGRGGRGR